MDADDIKHWSQCRICGAVVSSKSRHREWHAKNGDEEPPKRPGGAAFF